MQEICAKCGLPRELCVCETISKEVQKIRVSVLKKRFGKVVTLVEGIDEKAIDLRKLASELKSKLACGGTAKEGRIELQGDHKKRARELLIEKGFSKDSID